MAHTVETADKHYDRSKQTEGKHGVLDTIQKIYKEAEGEMEKQNSYWYADEERNMVMLRGRKDLENFDYEKEEGEMEEEMQNSYWYADEEGNMVMPRGRKGMDDFGDEEDKEEDIGDEGGRQRRGHWR